jgi:hypothetical protein
MATSPPALSFAVGHPTATATAPPAPLPPPPPSFYTPHSMLLASGKVEHAQTRTNTMANMPPWRTPVTTADL